MSFLCPSMSLVCLMSASTKNMSPGCTWAHNFVPRRSADVPRMSEVCLCTMSPKCHRSVPGSNVLRMSEVCLCTMCPKCHRSVPGSNVLRMSEVCLCTMCPKCHRSVPGSNVIRMSLVWLHSVSPECCRDCVMFCQLAII